MAIFEDDLLIEEFNKEQKLEYYNSNARPITEIKDKKPKKKFKFIIFQSPQVTTYRIGHYRPYNPGLKLRSNKGGFLNISDYGEKLIFNAIKYDTSGGKFKIIRQIQYILKYKLNKHNQKVFTFVSVVDGAVKHCNSGYHAFCRLMSFAFKKEYPVYNKRITRTVKRWFKNNNLVYNKTLAPANNIQLLCYPALGGLMDIYCSCPTPASSVNHFHNNSIYFKQPTLKLAIKKAFGSKGKMMVKLVCESISKHKHFGVFFYGKLLKNLIPYEYFYQIIPELNNFLGFNDFEVKFIREFLTCFSKERILSWFVGENFQIYELRDTARMWRDYKDKLTLPEKPKTILEIHNQFARDVSRIENPEIIFKIEEEILKLEDLNFGVNGEFRIKIPRSNWELNEWSSCMSNCIASYSYRMRDSGGLLVAVFKNNTMTYNIEILNKSVRQFSGIRNSPPEKEDKEIVCKFLEETKLIKPVQIRGYSASSVVIDEILD